MDGVPIGAFGNALIDIADGQANATGGKVTVEGGQYFQNSALKPKLPDFTGIAGNLITAANGSAIASNGTVEVSAGTIHAVELSSAEWQSVGVAGNFVRIDEGSGTAETGTVSITGGDHTINFFGNQLYSPQSADLTANNGSIFVQDAVVGGVHANYAYTQTGKALSTNGRITAQNASINGNTAGNYAFSWGGAASSIDGSISLDGSQVDYANGSLGIIASTAESQIGVATSSNGSIHINNTTVTGSLATNSYLGVTGTYANVIYGTKDFSKATAQGGTVEISESTIGESSSLYVVGTFAKVNSGYGDTFASGGKAILHSGSIFGSLRGAISRTTNGTAEAYDNRAIMYDGSITNGTLYGAYVLIGSGDGEAIAERNSVWISGGNVDGTMVEGSYAKAVAGSSLASGNAVTISGGNVSVDFVIGGRAKSNSAATATGNTVQLSGHTEETVVAATIIGGYAEPESSSSNPVLTTSDNAISIAGYNLDISQSSLYGGRECPKFCVNPVYGRSGRACSPRSFSR